MSVLLYKIIQPQSTAKSHIILEPNLRICASTIQGMLTYNESEDNKCFLGALISSSELRIDNRHRIEELCSRSEPRTPLFRNWGLTWRLRGSWPNFRTKKVPHYPQLYLNLSFGSRDTSFYRRLWKPIWADIVIGKASIYYVIGLQFQCYCSSI